MNKIELIGYLGKSPERKTTKNTVRTFAVFSLATQSAWKDANEEYQRKVEWHHLVVIWNLSQFQSHCENPDRLLERGAPPRPSAG